MASVTIICPLTGNSVPRQFQATGNYDFGGFGPTGHVHLDLGGDSVQAQDVTTNYQAAYWKAEFIVPAGANNGTLTATLYDNSGTQQGAPYGPVSFRYVALGGKFCGVPGTPCDG